MIGEDQISQSSSPIAIVPTENKPKWNSLLKPKIEVKEDEKVPSIGVPPTSQPNRRDSANEDNIKKYTNGAELAGIAKMLDIGLWDRQNQNGAGSPMSPIRSPVVADWKIVGSPIVNLEHSSLAYEDPDITIIPSTTSMGSMDSCMRQRRQRAMSLVEKSLQNNPTSSRSFTPSNSGRTSRASLANDNSTPDQDEMIQIDKLESNSQGAQLPLILLQEELGVKDGEEVKDIIKRSSMESLTLSQKDQSKTDLQSYPFVDGESEEEAMRKQSNSLFGAKMPFGPSAIFSGNSWNNGLGAGDDAQSNPTSSSRRHSLLFGTSEWSLDHTGTTMGTGEFSIDDYFLGNFPAGQSVPPNFLFSKKNGRRHSVATTLPEVDDHFGSLSLKSRLESSLSPSAAAFQYKGALGGYSSSNLIDYLNMASSPSHGDSLMMSGIGALMGSMGDENNLYDPITLSAARDASFQLSTYKGPLYAVEFKAGRTEIFYVLEIDCRPQLNVRINDLVIVEADRGEDLGKITMEISVAKLKNLMMPGFRVDPNDKDSDILTPELAALVHSKEIIPKRIHRLALSNDLKLLQAKAQEEAIAMVRCQSRIRQKKLPMEVVDAEYQWDRNKLTFYFCADRRIDFRELVRDLFRIYKTRIWMCAVDKSSPRMLMFTPGSSQSTTSSNSDYGGTYYGSTYPSMSSVLPL